ncbi:sodium:solute symporter family protein [Mammaliicoccus lentus]|uniref:sodium:solute symporter family protein n=1 Tax=Mammaliicoccus lentus TaxID=42858 RepID=UPI002648323D|nr:sodium:solute symporter family protein [Mammaliicoccus lentus]
MFNNNEQFVLGFIIIIYFVFLLIMSLYIKQNIKTYDDYNMASRTVSVIPLILTFVGTGVGGATLLGYMENGYTLGMGQQWIHITMISAVIILALFFLKRIRLLGEKYNMVTIGDYTALRYGESARIPTVISFLFAYCAMTGMQFVAIASILNLTLGLNMTVGIILGWVLLTIKTYLGGLKAVIWQDVIQGTILTVGIIVLFFVVIYHSGGWSEVQANAINQNQNDMLDFLNITPNEILIYLLTLAFYQFIRQDVWQRIWAAKNLKTARNGYWISMFIAVILGAMTVLIGVYSKFGLNLDITETPLVYYHVIQEVFPFPLVVVMIMVLLAAVISSADSFFIAGASSIANDIIKPNVKISSQKKMLLYSKVSVLIVSVISLILSLMIPGLVNLMVTGTAMSVSGLLAPVVFGLFWQRPTKIAGNISMWSGLGSAVIWQILGHPFGIHPILVGLPLSIIMLLVVTFLSKKDEATI